MEIETLAWGYTLPEAVRVDTSGYLYFSDALGDGGVYRRSPAGEIETLIHKRKLVGGLVLHKDGGFVMAGEDLRYWKDGASRILLTLDGVFYFCDLHTDHQGAVYVASVRTNIEELMQNVKNPGSAAAFEEMKAAMTPGECYRINPDGSVDELYDDVLLGNGIGFSPDGQTMYHVDSYAQGIIVHDIDAAGKVSNRRLIGQSSFTRGSPDGMCIDAAGNLWVAHVGGGRVVRLSPTGDELSEIKLPATRVCTLTLAGDNMDDMYICSMDNLDEPSRGGTIFRIRHSGFKGLETTLAVV